MGDELDPGYNQFDHANDNYSFDIALQCRPLILSLNCIDIDPKGLTSATVRVFQGFNQLEPPIIEVANIDAVDY